MNKILVSARVEVEKHPHVFKYRDRSLFFNVHGHEVSPTEWARANDEFNATFGSIICALRFLFDEYGVSFVVRIFAKTGTGVWQEGPTLTKDGMGNGLPPSVANLAEHFIFLEMITGGPGAFCLLVPGGGDSIETRRVVFPLIRNLEAEPTTDLKIVSAADSEDDIGDEGGMRSTTLLLVINVSCTAFSLSPVFADRVI